EDRLALLGTLAEQRPEVEQVAVPARRRRGDEVPGQRGRSEQRRRRDGGQLGDDGLAVLAGKPRQLGIGLEDVADRVLAGRADPPRDLLRRGALGLRLLLLRLLRLALGRLLVGRARLLRR